MIIKSNTLARKRTTALRSRGLDVSRCRAAAMADVAKSEIRQRTTSDLRISLSILPGLRSRDDHPVEYSRKETDDGVALARARRVALPRGRHGGRGEERNQAEDEQRLPKQSE